MANTITLISDLGSADGQVGQIKSVIAEFAPLANIVDLTHDVTPFATNEASYVLARSVDFLQPGIVMCMVDPHDGRPVIVEVGDGQSYLVGPDNGVMAAAVALVGGATNAFEIEFDSSVGVSKSRDIMAPVVAKLAAGTPANELGKQIDSSTLVPQLMPVAEIREDGSVDAQVLWIDRFGNIHLNLEGEHLAKLGATVEVTVDKSSSVMKAVNAISELAEGEVGVLPNSSGLVSIAALRANAAEIAGILVGAHVQIAAATLESGSSTHVEIKQ